MAGRACGLLFCAGCAGRSQVNGLAGKFCLALSAGGFPLGTHLLPLLRYPLAVAAYVHHHAHFCQQQDQTGAAGRENGRLMPVFGMVLVTTAMLQNTCHAICAMMPMPTMVQYRFSAL